MAALNWCICGTVPDADFPLTLDTWGCTGDTLTPQTAGVPALPVQRGTAALLATATLACQALNVPVPKALLVGDTGHGDGSRALYATLAKDLPVMASHDGLDGLTFHYLYPDVDWHNKVLLAVQELPRQPLLVADAGFMYVAKMSGYASSYDLFTPDVGELAFLADEKAPHPFYTRGFLLAKDEEIPHLVSLACRHGDAARHLLVKGKTDYCYRGENCLGAVAEPQIPALEPIGGTGDVVTGLVTGLLASGLPMPRACLAAATTARIMGQLAQPTPATQITGLLPYLAKALSVTLMDSK